MGTFLFYTVIFAAFFFLVILPLRKKYGAKETTWSIPKGKSFSESFSEDTITNPAYDNLRENIYHRD